MSTTPDQHGSLEQLAGLIERVTFHNAEIGFGVLQVKARGMPELVTVLGTLPEVRAGEWIETAGRWVIDRPYGRQFRAVHLHTAAPNTVDGMLKYLASGLTQGIGSDSSGGAGIQADLKTFTVFGVYGASALTAITAQNTVGVPQIKTLSPAMVRDQIDAVVEDLPPAATETGMLAHAGIIREVARAVSHHCLRPLVVDL